MTARLITFLATAGLAAGASKSSESRPAASLVAGFDSATELPTALSLEPPSLPPQATRPTVSGRSASPRRMRWRVGFMALGRPRVGAGSAHRRIEWDSGFVEGPEGAPTVVVVGGG